MALSLFDLDETLLPVDSDYLWSVFMVEKGYISDKDFMVKKDLFKQDYMQGNLDIYAYISFMAHYLNVLGHSRHRYQQEFLKEIVLAHITPPALSLVREHREVGDTTVIITATNEFIVRGIAPLFEVDYLICSELEVENRNGESIYTGDPKGVPSFREGKVKRVEAFLKENTGLGWKGSSFYSDSLNDIPLLERVDHPVAVNPDPRLREHAQSRGWRILDLHGKKSDQKTDQI